MASAPRRTDARQLTFLRWRGLRTALEALGFDPNGLDGIFGNGTRAALTGFQGANGLPQTPGAAGIDDVGAATIAALAAQLDAQQIARFPCGAAERYGGGAQ